jgi:PadR family transcriptional regulator PadR
MEDVRPTLAVVTILGAFIEDPSEARYGYGLMQATGYKSGKVYQILTRLMNAGWLHRHDDPNATPESGGPPRITYTLKAEAVPLARRLVNEARAEVAPAKGRRPARQRAWQSVFGTA